MKEKTELEKLMEMSFDEAIDFAVKKKTPDWKKNTRKAYKSSVGYLKEAAAVAGINAMRFIELKRAHFRLLLDQVKDLRKLTPKGYNKYRTHLSSLLSELEEFDLLENNPVEKIKTKDVIKTKAHRPPTAAKRKLIIDRMRICYPNYYRFLAVSYACTLRPHEICALKIKDLIREEQIFRITPIKEEENSKTNIERDVIIPDWLMLRLNELKLEKYKSEWYIFSAKDRTKSFTPGARRMSVDTSTRWWRDIVKKDLNLNVDQYSLKKMAGNDMMRLFYNERANDLIDMPRQQMGHTSSKMTEIYVDEHKEIMNEILRRKMPVL